MNEINDVKVYFHFPYVQYITVSTYIYNKMCRSDARQYAGEKNPH